MSKTCQYCRGSGWTTWPNGKRMPCSGCGGNGSSDVEQSGFERVEQAKLDARRKASNCKLCEIHRLAICRNDPEMSAIRVCILCGAVRPGHEVDESDDDDGRTPNLRVRQARDADRRDGIERSE